MDSMTGKRVGWDCTVGLQSEIGRSEKDTLRQLLSKDLREEVKRDKQIVLLEGEIKVQDRNVPGIFKEQVRSVSRMTNTKVVTPKGRGRRDCAGPRCSLAVHKEIGTHGSLLEQSSAMLRSI